MAKVPINSLSSGKARLGAGRGASRGAGRRPAKAELPIGGITSLILHGGLLASALLAWQVTPRIMPEDVITVDMVSDTPSVKGENTEAETAQTGVETLTPSPVPATTPPSEADPAAPASAPAPAAPAPTPPPPPQEPQAADTRAPTPPAPAILPPPKLMPPKPAPPRPAPPKAPLPPTPTAKPTPKPVLRPPPRPTPAPAPAPAPARPAPAQKAAPKSAAPAAAKATTKAPAKAPAKAPPAARTGQRTTTATPPVEFDLAAASNTASGADSGGRRAPQLASRGQAGRLGKAGGGAQLTGDLEAALRSQIKDCWLEPANMANADRLLVVVSMDLGLDGRLLRDPVLVTPSSRAGANASLVVAIDNALRAVRDCAPYALPPDRYDSWRQVRFNFDPRRMARP